MRRIVALLALGLAAATVFALSSASACPSSSTPKFSPAPGETLAPGATIVVTSRDYRVVPFDTLGPVLMSGRDVVPLRVTVVGKRTGLTPERPLVPGATYKLALTRNATADGRTAVMQRYWWVAGGGHGCGSRSGKLSFLARLFGFGFVPFGFGYLATRRIIVRRRKKIIRDLLSA